MPGTLYLIPNSLGPGSLESVIPEPVRAQTASLDCDGCFALHRILSLRRYLLDHSHIQLSFYSRRY
jgi:hypothetical protein